MLAILRREFNAYFTSPIGYIYLSVFYIFSGFFFFSTTLASMQADISGVYGNLFLITLFLIPILTMRLLSDDRKQKTDQALLTAPINLTGLVLGKFLAAFVVFLMGVAITLVYAVVVAAFQAPNWTNIFGNLIAFCVVGASLISIGMFISSLTENQVIAAIGGFTVMFMLTLIDTVANIIPVPFVSNLFRSLSFMSRYQKFTTGIFSFTSILFFLSVTFIFIFLTIRVFEKRRWG